MSSDLEIKYNELLTRVNKQRQYHREYNSLKYNTDETYCEAMKESSRKYYKNNFEKMRERARKYYEENKEAICERKKQARLAKKGIKSEITIQKSLQNDLNIQPAGVNL